MASARGYVVALRQPGWRTPYWLAVRPNGVADLPTTDRAAATVLCEAAAALWAATYSSVGWLTRIEEVW